MARYDAYAPQPPVLSSQRGWLISALTGSLVVHAGLLMWFHFQKLNNFGGVAQRPATESLHRVRIYEDPKKIEEIKAVLPEKKTEPKKELTLPAEMPPPDEISVKSQHKKIEDKVFTLDDKPTIDLAKLNTVPKLEPDQLLPKLPDDMFVERGGTKISARPASAGGPDGDGSATAIQVAGQDVEGILSGLTAGKGTSRRLSLPGNLTFAYDSADVSNEGRAELEKIAEAFRKFLGNDLMKATFIIEGHTDPTGTPEYNQKLSERRAESVRAWFVANLGLVPEKVQIVGYGATRPVAGVPTEGTVEELQGHRRTEIIVRRPRLR